MSEPFEIEVLQRLSRIETKMDGSVERLVDIENDLYKPDGISRRLTVVETQVNERTDPKKVASVTSFLTALITVLGALFAREAGI